MSNPDKSSSANDGPSTDPRSENGRKEGEADPAAATAGQQQQPAQDNALATNGTPNSDNGHSFFLDETKGRWIAAQENLGLTVRGPSVMVEVNKVQKNGRVVKGTMEMKGPILNMDFIRSTMELPRAVLDGKVPDADTALTTTTEVEKKEFENNLPQKYSRNRSIGSKKVEATPRQLAKRAYHWIMYGGPDVKNPKTINATTGETEPNLDLIICHGYGNSKFSKNCKCCQKIRTMMRDDRDKLRKKGNEDDRKNADRIHQARWIRILTKLLEGFRRIPIFPLDQETVFAFLSVATPYASSAKRNAAPDYVFSVEGISIRGCHYLPCELLGDRFTYQRCKEFQSLYLSGLAHNGNKYVRSLHCYQKRNSVIWTAMMEISIDNGKWPDFTPNTVAGPKNISTSTIAKYLGKKLIQIASHDNDSHVKSILPYYSNLRKLLVAFLDSGYLLVSHPVLSSETTSLDIEDRRTSILLTLEGKESFEGLIHHANAGMAEITDCIPLLSAYYDAVVIKAGYSGKKKLKEVLPRNYRNKATPNKRKRSESQMEIVKVPSESDEEEGGNVPAPEWDHFLTPSPGCSNILQHGGEMSEGNCWEEQLHNIAGEVAEDVRPLCQMMHKLCIDVCLQLLPKGKRGPQDSYNVQSSLTFMMNFRDLDDKNYCVEASHLDYSPEKVKELNDKGIYSFVGLVPLLPEGNFTRIHPHLDAKIPDTMRGNVVFSPLGTLLFMPASMIYGCGMRMGPNGNPCIKVHYFLSEKGGEEFVPLNPKEDLGEYLVPLAHLTGRKEMTGKKGTTFEEDEDVYFLEDRKVRMMAMECLTNKSLATSEEAEGQAEEQSQALEADKSNIYKEEEKMDGSKGLFQTGKLKNLIILMGS